MSHSNSFGYKEELSRSMNGFSSFAVSFSLMSVLTGIFANFNFGYQQAGSAIIWSWMLVAVGQFFVAFVMSRLSIQYPIVGYGYQWGARIINTHFGFFIGWFLLIQFITGFPTICKTFTTILIDMLDISASETTESIFTLFVISLVSLIHILGIKVASKINDYGVYAEIIGVVFIITILLSASILSENVNYSSLESSINYLNQNSLTFSSFALSLLLGTWCLTGFEAAADLAEETKAPTKTIPKAIMLSIITSSITGLLIIIFLVLQANDIEKTKDNLLLAILTKAIGVKMTSTLLIFILISIFACAVASMATASRLLFSFSRDKIFPYSDWISVVGKKSKSPNNAILLIWIFSCLSILGLKRIEIISSVSALAAYLGYTGIMIAALKNKSTVLNERRFYNKNYWLKAIQWIALCWVVFVVIMLAYPESNVEGFETKHLPLITTSISILIGILLYFFYVRRRINEGIAGPPNQKI